MKYYQVVVTTGVITFTLFVITLISGLKHWNIETHKHLAMATAAFAVIHGGLYFYKKLKALKTK